MAPTRLPGELRRRIQTFLRLGPAEVKGRRPPDAAVVTRQVCGPAGGGAAGLHRRAESGRQRRAAGRRQRLQRHVLHQEALRSAVAGPGRLHQPR